MMNPALILGGQMLGSAFACGLNLYATIAVLGLAGRLDWIAELPPGLRGLENGVVIGAAIALFVAEFIIDRVPYADTVWEAVHTVIRPGAAALLAVLALQDAPWPWYLVAGAAGAAAVVALAAHGSKAGVRLILANRRARAIAHGTSTFRNSAARTAASLLEDAAAIGVVIAALLYPGAAVAILAACLGVLVLAGPRLWRAAFLGLFAVAARLRGFFGRKGWRSRAQVPRWIRTAVPENPLGTGPVRAARATLSGMPGVGPYRHGWLVFCGDRPRFLYRAFFRTRTADLPAPIEVRLTGGVLTDTLSFHANGSGPARRLTLHLLKDGPPAELARAELQARGRAPSDVSQ
jgi:hypothetical protein